MLNFTSLFAATTTLTRDNHFTIVTPKGSLENKTFTSLIRVLVRDGKLLNSPVRDKCVFEYDETESVFIISAATEKRGEISIKAPITDGAIDPLNITIVTDEGKLNLMKAVFHSPLIMTQLNILLPALISASWRTYNALEVNALAKEAKEDAVDKLKQERRLVLAALDSGQCHTRDVVRSNYDKQIKAIEQS